LIPDRKRHAACQREERGSSHPYPMSGVSHR